MQAASTVRIWGSVLARKTFILLVQAVGPQVDPALPQVADLVHGVHRGHEGATADDRRGGLGEAAGTQFNTVKNITLQGDSGGLGVRLG